MILQHIHGLSDEQLLPSVFKTTTGCIFCEFDYVQLELPSVPSSMTRWRNRLGEKGIEKILAETIVTAVRTKTVAPKDLEMVIADITVMEKNILFPTDTKLLNRVSEQLVVLGMENGLKLRQTYARIGKYAAFNAGRYGHAKQLKRMCKRSRN